jgi:hypothetical protein
MSNNSLLLEELGRAQTVKDVQAAYNRIVEAKRQYAVRMKHARLNKQKAQAEMECFLDDLQHITGLELDSPLFIKLAVMTIEKRLQRRNLNNEEFADPFPNGW